MRIPLKVVGVLSLLLAAFPAFSVRAQQYDSKLYSEMRWRCIGPFRGGRTVAIAGVPQQPLHTARLRGYHWRNQIVDQPIMIGPVAETREPRLEQPELFIA